MSALILGKAIPYCLLSTRAEKGAFSLHCEIVHWAACLTVLAQLRLLSLCMALTPVCSLLRRVGNASSPEGKPPGAACAQARQLHA